MATSNILLLQKVNNLGYEGDVVTVRAGYARNYLLPQGFAVPVNRANKKQIEALQIRRQARELKELEEAKLLADQLRALEVVFEVKTGEHGKMFGAVTSSDLAKKFKELGFEVDRRKIHLEAVKYVGRTKASIKLHPEVTVEFGFEVVAEPTPVV